MLLHVGIKTVAFATLFGAVHAFAGSSLFALPGDLQSEAKRSVKLALNADYKTSYQVSEKIRAKNPGLGKGGERTFGVHGRGRLGCAARL